MGTLNPFRYRGYYYDTETGLFYVASRYYDPATGRFLNADSDVGAGSNILAANVFAYCNNNPVMRSDPSGHWSLFNSFCVCLAVTVLIVCILQPELIPAAVAALAEYVGAIATAFTGAAIIAEEVAPEIEEGVPETEKEATQLVNPNTIKYTQDSIGQTFGSATKHAGESIDNLIGGLKNGSITADDIPSIRVFKNAADELCSLDNRRLYCFKQADTLIRTVSATAEQIAKETVKKNVCNWDIKVR